MTSLDSIVGRWHSVKNGLKSWQSEYFKAGYNINIQKIKPLFPLGESTVKETDNLLSQFYSGVKAKIAETKEPFEKAYIFWVTHPSLIIYKKLEDMLSDVKDDDSRLLALKKLGLNILARLEIDKVEEDANKKHDFETLVGDFVYLSKHLIDLGIPKVYEKWDFSRFLNVSEAMNYLKILYNEPNKFVQRYAELYGYNITKNKG